MPNVVNYAVWVGILALVVSFSIVGGIIANTITNGDNHKDKMSRVPPPAPPPGAHAMRAMSEHHFSLTKDEHKLLATLAHRSR